uniref:Type II toxin-antitoxin system VapC family toxin n=1 Tax=Roseihalotalea indica TaxID=2867963 RepID=A0AA49JC54_9BACT|nr:type II toxin-antitoxin system VapC family toxin [Tunicatimonas sp. TK19036]
MKYLLDTNALLWAMENDGHLTEKAREAIINGDNDIYVSIASLWEIAIKLSINKLDLTKTIDEIIQEMEHQGMFILQISLNAIRNVRNMPFHHRDPFDRLIIAQAQADDLIVITKDEIFEEYQVKLHW